MGWVTSLQMRLILCGMFLLKCCMKPVIFLMNIRRGPKLPPITNQLLYHSATKLAHLIRTRQVSSEEVLTAYIDRIRAVNPLLNAVVEDRFADASNDARLVDRLLQTGNRSATQLGQEFPLLGVPLTVKESIAVQGLSHTANCRKRLGVTATEDAEVVRLLRAAGAIPILVSNTPELCMNIETSNKMTGTANNPHDLRRTPGGSSGGEAALLGCAGSVISVGSDIGGSLRIPAMFTGVFGHKPTPGVISISGHIPTTMDKMWAKYFVIGPMTRYAEDLLLMVKIMADENATQIRLNEEVDVRTLKYYYMEDDGGSLMADRVDPDIKAAVHKVVAHFESKFSIKVEKVNIKDLKNTFGLLALILRIEGVTNIFQRKNNPKEMNSVWMELFRFITCRSESVFNPILYGFLKKYANSLPEARIQQVAGVNARLKKQFQDMLGNDGVLFYPTFVSCAFFHNESIYKSFSAAYTLLCNTIELPATHCPVGLDRNGMPIGIQVIGSSCQDRLTIAVAKEIEEAFGGWIAPQAESA